MPNPSAISWVSIVLNIVLGYFAYRGFKVASAKPVIEILRVATNRSMSHDNDIAVLGPESFIEVKIINPSANGTHVKLWLSDAESGKPIENDGFYSKDPDWGYGDFHKIAAFNDVSVTIIMNSIKMAAFVGKFFILTLEDIRGRKIKKKFVFE